MESHISNSRNDSEITWTLKRYELDLIYVTFDKIVSRETVCLDSRVVESALVR